MRNPIAERISQPKKQDPTWHHSTSHYWRHFQSLLPLLLDSKNLVAAVVALQWKYYSTAVVLVLFVLVEEPSIVEYLQSAGMLAVAARDAAAAADCLRLDCYKIHHLKTADFLHHLHHNQSRNNLPLFQIELEKLQKCCCDD